MVHWVYVIKSSQTGRIYVGETTRLYRRWNEHQTGRGGMITSQDNYDTLIGLYHVGHNWSFMQYYQHFVQNQYAWKCAWQWEEDPIKADACDIENHIVERYRHDRLDNWWTVRGGKYCRTADSFNPNSVTIDRPLCKCGYVTEVKMAKDESKIYFSCPVPTWTEFEGVSVPNTCNFYEEFEPYRMLREKHKSQYANTMRKEGFAAFLDDTNDEFRQTA